MSARVAKFQEIANDIRAGIEDGSFPPGSRLPTREDLCGAYATSGATVSHALALLAQEGLVYTGQGFSPMVADRSGTTVKDLVDELMPALVAVRIRRGMDQPQVAELMGVKTSQVCELETGVTQNPLLNTYLRYALAVRVRVHVQLQDLDEAE